jgi:uncharacterized peroxidase-related enzyme
MSYLTSLPDDTALLEIFEAYPDTARVLLPLHEQVMRAPSPFTAGERELIAAYVSGLNACTYCNGIHAVTAREFGVPEHVLAAALDDLDSAPVDERMRPVLRYLGKLTRTPWAVGEADARAVYEAGWDERALHDAVLVCALFNFMNRMVDGLGVHVGPQYAEISGRRLHEGGYLGLLHLLGGR